MKKTFLFTIYLLSLAIPLMAQVKTISKDWHLLDYEKDSVYGISLSKAYDLLKDHTQKQKTIVAVIDSGGDINHEDLKDILWENPNHDTKTKTNGKGYIGDKNGWNFLGASDGTNFIVGTSEADREYLNYYKEYFGADTTKLNKKKMSEYHYFHRVVMPKSKLGGAYLAIGRFEETMNYKNSFGSFMVENFPDSTFSRATTTKMRELLTKNSTLSRKEQDAYQFFLRKMSNKKDLKVQDCADFIAKGEAEWRSDVLANYEKVLATATEIEKRRLATGFTYTATKTPIYGNGDVTSEVMFHGTHVGGIIGANRHNDKGIKGIADVQLMFLRVIAEGIDEADKDVALAIRYAVDHGARVINMSFGKSLSPQQHLVMDAIAYAEKKGVLLVHAAGNSSQNIDIEKNFPEALGSKKQKEASNMLTVGASGPVGGAAKFSNYGKKNVHLFAPGFNIYSTISDGKYKEMSGTSMAAPVVSGIAALLLNYFPELTAKELKLILMEGGISRRGSKTYLPTRKMFVTPDDMQTIDFGELSRSGKIVNAYQSVKVAIELIEKR